MLGMEKPSTKKAFSEGLPPRTTRSFFESFALATPGSAMRMRLMSPAVPASRRISSFEKPMLLAGIARASRKGCACTTTSPCSSSARSSSTSSSVERPERTTMSGSSAWR